MFEIITYGGGGLLEEVLNAVAMFFGASSYIYALQIAATLACLGILISSAFSGRMPDLKWMFGIILIYIFLFVPKVDVTVTDTVERAPGGMPTYRVVGNVPVGLAFAASFTSQMKDYFTRNIEVVFSMPTEINYRNGGPLFAQGIMESGLNAKPRSPNLSTSLANFWKDCVFFDIALGFYSMDALAKADDLQTFLANNTATNRMYQHVATNGNKTFEVCADSIAAGALAIDLQTDVGESSRMAAFFNNLANRPSDAARTNALLTTGAAAMPMALNYLTGMSHSATQMLTQTTLANSFQNGLVSFASAAEAQEVMQGYAAAKAEQERSITFGVMGKIAGRMLPQLNIIAEALIYAVFPIIGLMCMFPGSQKVIFGYIIALAWIALWAPLYAIFHFFSMYFTANAVAGAAQICTVANTCTPHLNLYTMGSMREAMANSANLAGYFATMVPMIAYMLVSRSGAMMASTVGRVLDGYSQPVSHAATEAAGGNVSTGNVQMGNVAAFQQNTAPSNSAGFMRTDDGRTQSTMTTSGQIDQIRVDSGPASMNAQSALSSQVSTQLSDATKATQQASESLTQANVNRFNTLMSAEQAVNRSTGVGTTQGVDNKTSNSETYANVSSSAKEFAKRNGISEEYMTAALAEAGLQLPGVAGVSASARNTEGYHRAQEAAEKFLNSQEYRSALSKSEDAYMQRTATDRSEVAATGRDAVSNASEQSAAAQTAYSAAVTKEQALQQLKADIDTKGVGGAGDLSGYLKERVAEDDMNWTEFSLAVNRGDTTAMRQLDGYVNDYAQEYVEKAVKASPADIEAQGRAEMAAVKVKADKEVDKAEASGTTTVSAEQNRTGTGDAGAAQIRGANNAQEAEAAKVRADQGDALGANGAAAIGAAAPATEVGDDGRNYVERAVDQAAQTSTYGRAAQQAVQSTAEAVDQAANGINDGVEALTGVDLYRVGKDAGFAGRPVQPGVWEGEPGPAPKPSAADNRGDNRSGD